MTTKKTLLPTNDLYIQFTEEELSSIGAGPGTKFDAKLHDDGSIELRPYAKLEVDLEDFPREILELIIKDSCEQDISANDVISNLLKESLNISECNKDRVVTSPEELLLEKDYLYNACIDPNSTNEDTSICNS